MFEKRKTEVLVVGGGPVGLFTALSLADQGIRVQVIDEQWRTAARSYALAVHPASLKLFDVLGFAKQLLEVGNNVETLGLYGEGQKKKELKFSALQGEYQVVTVLPQHALEEVLIAQLEKRGIKVLWNHKLAGLEVGVDGAAVRIERLAKESTGYSVARTEWVVDKVLDENVQFVIGADGHRSMVRRNLGIDFQEIGPASTFAVFEFLTEGRAGSEMQVVLEENSTSVLWPMCGGRYRWSFELPESVEGLDSRVKSRLLVQVRDKEYPHISEERLRELISERAPWFDPTPTEVVWSAAIRFERRLAESFGEGRVWLIGDSAHLAFPIGIQSMNIGFREAQTLSSQLYSVLREGNDLSVVDGYGQKCRSEWKALLDLADNPPVSDQADQWIRSRASRIPSCLPVSGDDMDLLLKRLL